MLLAALNFNIPESPEKMAEKVAEKVLQLRQTFPAYPVVYGGALFPGNVQACLQFSAPAGVFIGSSSLEAEPFADICAQPVLST